MKVDLSVEGFPGALESTLGMAVSIRGDRFVGTLSNGNVVEGPSTHEIGELLQALATYDVDGEATIFHSREMEMLVREEAPSVWPSLRRRSGGAFQVKDGDQGVTYTLGSPSDHFILFLVDRISSIGAPGRFFLRHSAVRLIREHEQGELLELQTAAPAYTLLNVLRDATPRLFTLRIQSERDLSSRQFQSFADSFAFQLAYNLDSAFVAVRSLEDVVRRARLRHLRRVRLDELDPPRRTYGADLVYQYQMGVATDSVPLEFLSYYHVAEHFFDSVFEEDLIESVRDALTRPGFSFRRRVDIRSLLKQIRERLKAQREDVTYSEQEALRLVIERYVRTRSVADQLMNIQPSLVEYYAQREVPFSKGDTANLMDDDAAKAALALSRRIYKTRNAVVHSKDGGKPRYTPFLHDRELAQELPLMRLVAEEIIINSGTALSSP